MNLGKKTEIAVKSFVSHILSGLLEQPARSPSPPYKRILIIRYGGIGDMILSPCFTRCQKKMAGSTDRSFL